MLDSCWKRGFAGAEGAGPARPPGGAAGAALRGSRAGSAAAPGCPEYSGNKVLRSTERTGKLHNGCIIATLCFPLTNQTSSVTLKVALQERCRVCLPAQTYAHFFNRALPGDCFQKPVFKCCQVFYLFEMVTWLLLAPGSLFWTRSWSQDKWDPGFCLCSITELLKASGKALPIPEAFLHRLLLAAVLFCIRLD